MAVSRRLVTWACLVTVAGATGAGQAAAPTFPYEAVVQSEGAYVRSGPGKSYYPTARLDRGSRVSVRRHDPGGWFMVAPPAGSFSWVRGEHVKQTAPGRGVLTADNVVVRVGSTFGDETREVEQVRLSTGDEVEIVEQKTLPTERGPTAFYKIRPPQGEYRWVAGQDLAAAPTGSVATSAPPASRNPFMPADNARRDASIPSVKTEAPEPFVRNSSAPKPSSGVYEPKGAATDDVGVRTNGPDTAVVAAQRQRLSELDTAFREMVERRTGEWNFAPLEQGYAQLQREAALPATASQVKLRLEALERYGKIKAEYDDLMQLTTESRRRDAELLSMQGQAGPSRPASTPSRPVTTDSDPFAVQPVPAPQEPPVLVAPDAQDGWVPSGPREELAGGTAPPSRPVADEPPKFDGAGVVQRTPVAVRGMPQHVLITPQGRVLAYLAESPGVNLDQYVGRSMGLYGQRFYRQDLRADLLVVRELTPVRLAP